MREVTFLRKNEKKWSEFEQLLLSGGDAHPRVISDLYTQITDDLAYAQTFYNGSRTHQYLNGLARRAHNKLYRDRREPFARIKTFWVDEVPHIMHKHRLMLLYSFIIFAVSCGIGAFSAANDPMFVRLIMGDQYVNMTLENIGKGDPMAVYKSMQQTDMFLGITFNNVRVSLLAFGAGLLFSFGTGLILFYNGVMLGSFQYFFYEHELLLTSVLTIWIHGTLEISAIIVAGAAGMVMGNSLLFPGTFSRLHSFQTGAREGLKIVVALVPVFFVAGFLESYVTRLTELPDLLKTGIILLSLLFVIWYFLIYPAQKANNKTYVERPY
ncbi:MAG: stage II sporulation protein M [Cyclonatronaceae bacterium]